MFLDTIIHLLELITQFYITIKKIASVKIFSSPEIDSALYLNQLCCPKKRILLQAVVNGQVNDMLIFL